jgi:D-glycero-alpha-D-manno-heptose 1-phosphate guanylyltransferase
MHCIILAGGLGTRIRSAIGNMPKCMAPVAGQPFLYYLLRYLEQEGCTKAILALGYRHEVVTDWLEGYKRPFAIEYSIEEAPLGTGGAIKQAMGHSDAGHVVVVNGDTYFPANLNSLLDFHEQHNAAATLALKELENFNRYGLVRTNNDGRILSFEEKQETKQGTINGGIYAIDRQKLLAQGLPDKFSFEKDFLEPQVASGCLYGLSFDNYFLDIGIPEDYNQAQEDFKTLPA